MQERFPAEFEAAFNKAYPSAWSSEYAGTKQQCPMTSTSWAGEFHNQPDLARTEWIDEFKTFEATQSLTEDQQMAEVAEGLLGSLDLSDPKLAQSKFVAFLQNLSHQNIKCPVSAGVPDFALWKRQYLENIGHLRDNHSVMWESMEKGWDRYSAEGYGYDQFAAQNFSKYRFSVPPAANIYHGRSSALLAEQLASSGDLRGAILAYEALLQEDPSTSSAWLRLGTLQQLNEMDVQAIPALRESLRLGDASALLPLAASLVNESCIPEALDTIQRWLESVTGRQMVAKEGPTMISTLISSIETTDGHVDGNVALSILYSITGNHAQASECLERALFREPNRLDLLNRMGAILANNQRYPEALRLYDQSLSLDPTCPRVHYNRGVSLMCSKYHEDATKSFIRALQNQLPVDVVEGVDPELVERYTAIWDTLRSNCEASGCAEDMMRAIEARDLHSLIHLIS